MVSSGGLSPILKYRGASCDAAPKIGAFTQTTESSCVSRPCIIAIADDEEEVRLSTRDLLRSYGAQVLLFDSAEALLASADLPSIDALVTDYKMAGMNAAELILALHARGAEFPVIVISALEAQPTGAQVTAAGARAFLSKPVDPNELIGALACLRSARSG